MEVVIGTVEVLMPVVAVVTVVVVGVVVIVVDAVVVLVRVVFNGSRGDVHHNRLLEQKRLTGRNFGSTDNDRVITERWKIHFQHN